MAENLSENIKEEMNTVGQLKKLVDDLYEYRDHYFECNPIDKAIQKTDDVRNELKKVLEAVDSAQSQIESNTDYLLLKGRALNVLPDFSPEATDCLSRAVKLDPKLVEAWNHLGECYWKKKDVEGAKNCFTGALNYSKNKVSLRNLSMVLRQLGGSPQDHSKNLQQSMDYSKEAVMMDLADGMSWFIAGNAYLTAFFASGQKQYILKQCLSAYNKAEKDCVTKNNSDLHFNKATIYFYQEEYQLALEGFTRASALDPLWPEPQNKKKETINFLSRVTELVKTKGKLKSKKLKQMMSSLKDQDLGPYQGGSFTSPKGEKVKLELCPFSRLTAGKNSEKVVIGKVVCNMSLDEPIPFTFAMVDAEGTCFAVNVYNIAQGQGVIIGDSVAIPEPHVLIIDFTADENQIQFSCIRVSSPIVLVVNGRKLGLDKQAPTILSFSTISE